MDDLRGDGMERAGDWMDERVREEIEDLATRYGFEEREALAYWHLAQARLLMTKLMSEDERARRASVEEEYQGLHEEIADTVSVMAAAETRIAQHFSALYRELGLRVLRRSYPEGWTDTRI